MASEPDEYDEIWEALGKARFRIWFCSDRKVHGQEPDENGWPKPTVEWIDGVAHCLHPSCENKSTDKREE